MDFVVTAGSNIIILNPRRQALLIGQQIMLNN